MPQQTTEVVKHSFGAFSLTLTLLLVLVVFCIMYFYVRRKKGAPQVDQKAGDEGEDDGSAT